MAADARIVLQQRLSQQLVMTPQLRQAIKILQVSRGFEYAYNFALPGDKVVPGSIKLNGTAIDPLASYRVEMNNFLASGGDNFTVFNENNTPGLPSSRIVKLFEDSKGNLWVGTESAGVVLVKQGRVIPLDIERGSREGRIRRAVYDHQGRPWRQGAQPRVRRGAGPGRTTRGPSDV